MVKKDKNEQIREPQQERSIALKKRIMDAARELFSEKGMHGATSNEIVKNAGVSVGSFYSYFRDKQHLFMEVLRDYIDEVYEKMHLDQEQIEIPEGADLVNAIAMVLRTVFRSFDKDPRFHSQTIALRFSDPVIRKFYQEAEDRELEFIRTFLAKLEERTEVTLVDREAAIKVIHSSISYLVHSIKFLECDFDEDRLIEEEARMIVRYLTF